MPIKKHILKVEKIQNKNYIQVPETICNALGINENSVVKVYSSNDGYSFKVETMLSFDNCVTLERYREENQQLKNTVNSVKKENETLLERIKYLEGNM